LKRRKPEDDTRPCPRRDGSSGLKGSVGSQAATAITNREKTRTMEDRVTPGQSEPPRFRVCESPLLQGLEDDTTGFYGSLVVAKGDGRLSPPPDRGASSRRTRRDAGSLAAKGRRTESDGSPRPASHTV